MKRRERTTQRYYSATPATIPAPGGNGGYYPNNGANYAPTYGGDWSDVYQARPARPASVAADVAVPGLQALISGLIAGALTLAGGLAFDYPLEYAGAVALAVLAIAWALLLADHRRLLWAVENLTRRDLDGDGATGEPAAAEPARLILEVKHTGTGDKRGLDFHHLGIDAHAFLLWARAALEGQTLAVGAWVGRGRPFSRGQYDALMGELERAGIIRLTDPKNPQSGRELTAPGRAALRACVREYATPTAHDATQAGGVGDPSGGVRYAGQ